MERSENVERHWMTYDITFCGNMKCPRIECLRKDLNGIPEYVPISMADFGNDGGKEIDYDKCEYYGVKNE